MKNLLTVLILSFFLFGFQRPSQDSSNDVPISTDAAILTLRSQRTGVFLDSVLAKDIDKALTSARTLVDTLNSIHARYDYAINRLILISSGSWTTAWKNGELHTGNKFIDSLSAVYSLDTVTVSSIGSSFFYTLTYGLPLQMKNLAKVYMKDPSIAAAEPDGNAGDGNNIEVVRKNGTWDLAFSLGFGDCMAGCMARYYWYITVDGTTATFIKEEGTDHTTPLVYQWNFPPAYDPTYFSSLPSLLDRVQNAEDWWVRQYAVESLGKLFVNSSSPFRNELFQSLKEAAIANKAQCVQALTGLIDDPDPDVQNSAILTLGALLGSGRGYSSYFPLHVGNSWTWSRPIGTDSIENITDTVMEGDTKYFRFNRLRELDTPIVTMDAYRATIIARSTQVTWLDFSLDVGDTYVIRFFTDPPLEWTVRIGSKDDTVHLGGKILSHCWRFDMVTCCDWGWSEWFAPGVGPVKRVGETIHGPEAYYLLSAQIDNTNIVLSAKERDPWVPSKLFLAQNYPNPFNPSTIINYELPAGASVTLKIYDVLGREILVLVSEHQSAGSHSVLWSAGNLPSGMYFYRLQAGPYTQTKKLLVLK